METKTTPTEPMEEPEAVEAETAVVGFEPIDDQPTTSEPVRPRDERDEFVDEFNELTQRGKEIMRLVKKSLRSAARQHNNDTDTINTLVNEEQNEVSLKVFSALRNGKVTNDDANIGRWLSKVSYNQLVSRHNYELRHQTTSLNETNPTTEEEFIESLPDESADTAEQALADVPSEKLQGFFNTLNDRQRQIIELHRQELSDAEIAVQLKMNVDTVRSNLFRIRAKAARYPWSDESK